MPFYCNLFGSPKKTWFCCCENRWVAIIPWGATQNIIQYHIIIREYRSLNKLSININPISYRDRINLTQYHTLSYLYIYIDLYYIHSKRNNMFIPRRRLFRIPRTRASGTWAPQEAQWHQAAGFSVKWGPQNGHFNQIIRAVMIHHDKPWQTIRIFHRYPIFRSISYPFNGCCKRNLHGTVRSKRIGATEYILRSWVGFW